jgi:DNA-binding transcriptional MerR regulator
MMPTRAPTERETWADWLPYATWGIQRDQLVEEIVDQYGVALDAQQIQSWEREGIIPPPIDGDTYPPEAEMLFRAALHYGIENHPAQIIRDYLRGLAAVLSQDMKREIHERLAELQRRQTWLDGLPDYLREMPVDAMYTRAEVLGSLQDRSVDVNEITLVYWEKAGILPRPIRRHRDNAVRALYPPWAVDAIQHVRELQAKGRTLDQIKPLMSSWKLAAVTWDDPLSAPLTDARTAHLAVAEAAGVEAARITYTFTDDNGIETFRREESIDPALRQRYGAG